MKYTPNLNLRKPDKEDFYDVEDFNANCDILDDAVTGGANLLVNPDFNVNTNGQASYTGTADVETVTKWISRSLDTTVTVTANGITVASGGSADAGIYQKVLPFAKYSDNEFVVTAYIGGEKYSAKGKAGSCEVVETDFTLAVEQMGTDVAVVIKVSATASINVENVALEVKGTFSPANYYDELGKSGYLVSNPNLLINPDFKINQRGQSSYSGYNKYTVDRWSTRSDSDPIIVVTPTNAGIIIANNSPTVTSGIRQFIEGYPSDDGAIYTFSAKINGEIYSYTGKTGATLTEEDFELKLLGAVSPINIIYPTIFVKPTKTITVEWAKLELGGVATPFVPPLMAEELVKCKRYYQSFKGRPSVILTGLDSANPHDANIIIPIHIPMRQSPTFTLGQCVVDTITGVYYATANYSLLIYGIDYVKLKVNWGSYSFTDKKGAYVWGDLDAEIY